MEDWKTCHPANLSVEPDYQKMLIGKLFV